MSCMELFDLRRVCHRWNSILTQPLLINKYVHKQRYSVYPAADYSAYERRLEETDKTIRGLDKKKAMFDVGMTYYSELEARYSPWDNRYQDPYDLSYVCFSVACWIFNEKCADFNFAISFEKTRNFYLALNADQDEWALNIGHRGYKLEDNPFMNFYVDPWMHFAITYHDRSPCGTRDFCVYINGCEQRLLESCYTYGASMNIWGDQQQCLVDLRLFPFILSSLEIEAINQQRCTFDVVQIGKALTDQKDSIEEDEWHKLFVLACFDPFYTLFSNIFRVSRLSWIR